MCRLLVGGTPGDRGEHSYDRADRITATQELGALSTGYTLDANGNTVQRGADTFSYDQANRLRSSTLGAVSYAYTGDGVRVSSTVGALTTRFVSDVNAALPVVLTEAAPTGTRKYVYGAGGLAYSDEGLVTGIRVMHTDGLGSVRALTDSRGWVVQTYQTDEFGVPEPLSSLGASTQPMQYTGEQRDSETGFVYLRARMYDPQLGRFIQADPLRKSGPGVGGWNRYTYVGNNPINRTDPSGLCVDPGGEGIRYCIERYIPTETTRIPLPVLDQIEFTGDNRGPSSEGGTFKLRQFISIRPDGTVDYFEDVGWTTGLGRREQGILGSCVAGAQLGTSGAAIAAACEGFIGVIGKLAPPIESFFVLQQSASGKARVLAASGTPYPSAEIWQYGGPNGVEQIYHFDPRDYGYTSLDLFFPRELPIQRTP